MDLSTIREKAELAPLMRMYLCTYVRLAACLFQSLSAFLYLCLLFRFSHSLFISTSPSSSFPYFLFLFLFRFVSSSLALFVCCRPYLYISVSSTFSLPLSSFLVISPVLALQLQFFNSIVSVRFHIDRPTYSRHIVAYMRTHTHSHTLRQ